MDAHLGDKGCVRFVEETFVFEMVTTLWRLRRQAPAESNLVHIQMQRMHAAVTEQFDHISPSALYALAVVELQEHVDALNQIARQGRRWNRKMTLLKQSYRRIKIPPTNPLKTALLKLPKQSQLEQS